MANCDFSAYVDHRDLREHQVVVIGEVHVELHVEWQTNYDVSNPFLQEIIVNYKIHIFI